MRTSLDRWLIRRYTVETHIYTMSDPGPLPKQAKRIEIPESAGGRYRYHFITTNESVAEQIIKHLKEHQHSFNTVLKNRKGAFSSFVNPHGRSFTFSMISRFFVAILIAGLGYLAYLAIFTGAFNEEFQSIIDFFNGGAAEDVKERLPEERQAPSL